LELAGSNDSDSLQAAAKAGRTGRAHQKAPGHETVKHQQNSTYPLVSFGIAAIAMENHHV